jgi:hypothetical protein
MAPSEEDREKKRKKSGVANTDHGRHLEPMGTQHLAVRKDVRLEDSEY